MPFLSTRVFFQCATPALSKPCVLCYFFIAVQCHGSANHMKEQTPYFSNMHHAMLLLCTVKLKKVEREAYSAGLCL